MAKTENNESEAPVRTADETPRCQALHPTERLLCELPFGHAAHHHAWDNSKSLLEWTDEDHEKATRPGPWGTREDLIALQEEIEDETRHNDPVKLTTSRDLTFKRIALALETIADILKGKR